MRTFHLSDAAFTALAAGRPSPETLGILRRAQQSRHLLLLSEIDRVTPGPTADTLADPMAALHTAATLAALRAGVEPPPARIASTRHLTAAHDGLTLRVRLEDTDPLRAGLGLTPSRPLTDDEAAGWQSHLDEAWRILVTRHRPAAETMAAVLSVIVPLEPAPSAAGISATSADAYGAVAISPPADGRSFAVGLLHETQHSVLNAVRTLFDLVSPPATPGYSPWRDDPRPPFGILHGVYAYLAVTRFWRTEAAAAGGPFGTLPRTEPAGGAISDAGILAPVVHLDPDKSAEGVARAEVEGRPREAAHGRPPAHERPGEVAHGRPAEALLGEAQRLPDEAGWRRPDDVGQRADGAGRRRADDVGRRLAEFEFARWRAAVVEAAESLLGGGVLTAAARRFVGAVRDEVAAWLHEAVDEDVARLAAGANADHRARWRLRNLEVAPEAIAALAAAWRRGAPPPPVPEPEVRAGGGRVLERSERLDHVHRNLRAAAEWDISPGDAAYLRGAHEAAFDAYTKEAGSGDLQLWAGLAVVSPAVALRERPEVVRALYLALPDVDLRTLAFWMGS